MMRKLKPTPANKWYEAVLADNPYSADYLASLQPDMTLDEAKEAMETVRDDFWRQIFGEQGVSEELYSAYAMAKGLYDEYESVRREPTLKQREGAPI